MEAVVQHPSEAVERKQREQEAVEETAVSRRRHTLCYRTRRRRNTSRILLTRVTTYSIPTIYKAGMSAKCVTGDAQRALLAGVAGRAAYA
jgi:hypothetical protein